jgi:hypothetical protein
MSSIAVFLVLGGATALAAGQLGKNTVGTKQIKAKAVTTAKIAKEAVAEDKIKNDAVTNAKIAPGAVNTPQLADKAVTTTKLSDKAVTTGQLGEAAVNVNKLADKAVTTAKLLDSAVTNEKLAANAVTSGKIQDGQILASDLGPVIIRTAVDTGVPTATSTQVVAICLGTERLLSGGGSWSGALAKVDLIKASFPAGNSWVAQGTNNSGEPLDFTAYALCLQ